MLIRLGCLLLLVLAAAEPIWAKSICKKRHLAEKDCYFSLGKNKFQVWQDKIFLNNKVDRDFKALPQSAANLKNNAVEWSFVYGYEAKGHQLLEIGLWMPSIGSNEIETLMWVVYQVKDGALIKQLEKSVQKRKKLITGKYKADRKITYGLTIKQSKINWQVGREKGSFQ
ncbi:MAG: hypothetical protein A2Z20_08780 [Bdellovibrionales bacterium RBG_16_40_8]|nr:MAG: hypothetical protein A2Z20_08780 [Bdellovibrionales bacterium RBG_16_40_8]